MKPEVYGCDLSGSEIVPMLIQACFGRTHFLGGLRIRTINRSSLIRFALLCGLLLVAVAAGAADKTLNASQTGPGSVSLTEYFAVLEDPGRSLTLADVQAPDMASRFKGGLAPAEGVSYGFTRSAYWLRLHLSNSSDQAIDRMLEVSYAVLSDLDFHHPGADGAYQSVTTGVRAPFSTRPHPGRFFVFPLTLPAHTEQVVYLRVRTDSAMLVPAKLWTPAEFHVYQREDQALQAWYFGMASAMILFNLLLFIALKDSAYLLYVGFALFTVLSISAVNGLGKKYLWPDSTQWANVAASVCYVGMYVALLLLMRRMLNTKETSPWVDLMTKLLIGLNLILPIGAVISPQTFAFPVRLLLGATGLLTLLLAVYCAVFKRQRIAMIFVTAYFMFVLGPILVGMKLMKALPVNFLTTNAILIGSVLEMLLMAFALAYRFNMIRSQATQAVEQANVNLEERLRLREADLIQSHQRLLEIERHQTLSEERQRLMQDMHDGMGSSLTSALRVVERGRMDEAQVAQVLKDCIDDLKLAIDSMEPVEADLLLLLATLRFRLGPRLESTGVALRWEVQDIPALDWLDPRSSLHILRILQEAFSNILKHTNATEIRVSTCADAFGIMVTISDNGQGFAVERALKSKGKGLPNQLRRAQAVGAEVRWDSDSSGTCLTLFLPFQRREQPEDRAVKVHQEWS